MAARLAVCLVGQARSATCQYGGERTPLESIAHFLRASDIEHELFAILDQPASSNTSTNAAAERVLLRHLHATLQPVHVQLVAPHDGEAAMKGLLPCGATDAAAWNESELALARRMGAHRKAAACWAALTARERAVNRSFTHVAKIRPDLLFSSQSAATFACVASELGMHSRSSNACGGLGERPSTVDLCVSPQKGRDRCFTRCPSNRTEGGSSPGGGSGHLEADVLETKRWEPMTKAHFAADSLYIVKRAHAPAYFDYWTTLTREGCLRTGLEATGIDTCTPPVLRTPKENITRAAAALSAHELLLETAVLMHARHLPVTAGARLRVRSMNRWDAVPAIVRMSAADHGSCPEAKLAYGDEDRFGALATLLRTSA